VTHTGESVIKRTKGLHEGESFIKGLLEDMSHS
jgi:hypothetical protein